MSTCLCFFFQAEDGIRAADVTGVQTCALPICQGEGLRRRNFVSHPDPLAGGEGVLRATKGARLAERISEARVANEFKRIVGAPNLNRLFDTELSAGSQFAWENDRTLVIAPATTAAACEVM